MGGSTRTILLTLKEQIIIMNIIIYIKVNWTTDLSYYDTLDSIINVRLERLERLRLSRNLKKSQEEMNFKKKNEANLLNTHK